MSGLAWWRQWMVAVSFTLRHVPSPPLLAALLMALLRAALLRVLVDIALTRGLVIVEVEV